MYPDMLIDKAKLARRMAEPDFECLVLDCTGRLSVEAEQQHPVIERQRSPHVPKFHLGCTATPMHVFTKESLYYLEPKLVATVEGGP